MWHARPSGGRPSPIQSMQSMSRPPRVCAHISERSPHASDLCSPQLANGGVAAARGSSGWCSYHGRRHEHHPRRHLPPAAPPRARPNSYSGIEAHSFVLFCFGARLPPYWGDNHVAVTHDHNKPDRPACAFFANFLAFFGQAVKVRPLYQSEDYPVFGQETRHTTY